MNNILNSFISKNKTVSVFLLFLFLYLALCSGHIGGDGLLIYFTAESLIFDGDFDLSNLRQDFGLLELQKNHRDIQESITAYREEGRSEYYAQYGLLMILLYALFYSVGYITQFLVPVINGNYITVFFVSLANCFVTALFAVYVYRFTKDIIGNEKRALLLAFAFGFGTFIADYALKSGFSEPLLGLTLFASFFHAFRYKNTRNNSHLLYSGLFAAASFLTKFYSFIGIGVIGLYVLWILYGGNYSHKNRDTEKSGNIASMAYFAFPIILGLLIFVGFNYIRYSALFEQKYAELYSQNSLFDFTIMHVAARAFNLLISPGKGLLIFAPILILAYWGFTEFYRTNKHEAVLCMAVFLSYFLFFSCFIFWYGDWSWGPRYLYFLVPFLIVPVSALLSDKNYVHWINKTRFLFALGIMIQLPSYLLNNGDFIRFSEFAGFERYRIMLPQFSPVVVGYVRIASALKRNIFGKSIDYPVIYLDDNGTKYFVTDEITSGPFQTTKKYVSLRGYDRFDIWMVNAWKVAQDNFLIKFAVVLLTLLAFSAPIIWYLALRRHLS